MRAALALTLLAAPAAAGPVYFAGPAVDLDARDAPGGAVIGALPAGPAPVEAVAIDPSGAWALVALPESGAWIATDGLARIEPPLLADAPIPVGLRCVGTEPFWSLSFEDDGALFSEPGLEPAALTLEAAAWPEPPDFPLPVRVADDAFAGVGLLRPATCSDGMSDRPYAWALDLLTVGVEGERRLSGCCFLPRF